MQQLYHRNWKQPLHLHTVRLGYFRCGWTISVSTLQKRTYSVFYQLTIDVYSSQYGCQNWDPQTIPAMTHHSVPSVGIYARPPREEEACVARAHWRSWEASDLMETGSTGAGKEDVSEQGKYLHIHHHKSFSAPLCRRCNIACTSSEIRAYQAGLKLPAPKCMNRN